MLEQVRKFVQERAGVSNLHPVFVSHWRLIISSSFLLYLILFTSFYLLFSFYASTLCYFSFSASTLFTVEGLGF
jgi:hypothetical protein